MLYVICYMVKFNYIEYYTIIAESLNSLLTVITGNLSQEILKF